MDEAVFPVESDAGRVQHGLTCIKANTTLDPCN